MDGQFLSKQASKQAKQERIDHIDLLRAFGILMMILGHINFGSIFNKWIHFFHMPMFFVISGFFYREQNIGVMVKRRFKTLLVPYLFFGLLHCVIYFIRNNQFDPHAFYILFWENTAGIGIPIAGALWFLTAMFITEVLFWCLQKIRASTLWSTIIAASVAVAGMVCASYLPFRLPWAIDVGMVGVGLYQAGKLIKEKWLKLFELKFIYTIIGIGLFSFLGLLCPYINLRTGRYGIWPMFWINALGMTISLWNISRYIYTWTEEQNILEKPLTWIKSIGRDSIVYLCLNQLSILIADDFVGLIIPSNGVVSIITKKIMILLVTLIELFVFQKLIMGTKLRVVMGK